MNPTAIYVELLQQPSGLFSSFIIAFIFSDRALGNLAFLEHGRSGS